VSDGVLVSVDVWYGRGQRREGGEGEGMVERGRVRE